MKTNQTENQTRQPASPITGRATLRRSLGEQRPTPARQEPRPAGFLAACGRWLSLALLLAGFTLAAHAQRTATATATISGGTVASIAVTDGGAGYSQAPVVILAGGGGTGATATALMTGDAVSQINVMTGGSGYTNAPDVILSAPPGQPTVLGLQMIPLLTIYGWPGDSNRIETSASLGAGAFWIPLTNVVLTSFVYEFYDRSSSSRSKGFYRAILLGGNRFDPGERFVWLPPGQFVMGSPDSEVGRYGDEGPQTQVTLTQGFFMGRYEVTQGEYLSVIGSNPSSFTGDTNRPVESMSWNGATNYCAQLTLRELTAGRLPVGWAYRLPTEAEWDYASRAGSTNRFGYGDDPGYTQLANYAWYSVNSGSATHTVSGKLPNRWGLYDMSGNVWELCSDWYAGVLPGGSVTDPQGSATGSYRVLRGGSWNTDAYLCRSAQRNAVAPTLRWSFQGFRVVLAQGQ
jgi:formylglycine-generating enzyme required for sulfatase activity